MTKKKKKKKIVVTPTAGEDVEELDHSYLGGNVRWGSHSKKQLGNFKKKLGMQLLYDPAILLLGICPR